MFRGAGKILKFALSALLSAWLLVACGQEDTAPPFFPDHEPGTGSIVAQVVWPGQAQPQTVALTSTDDSFQGLVPVGVSTIRWRVTASDITTPPEVTIAVNAGDSGTGIITGVPAGADRTLTVDGLNSGGGGDFFGEHHRHCRCRWWNHRRRAGYHGAQQSRRHDPTG